MARTAVTNRVASTRDNNVLYNSNFEIKPAVQTANTNVAGRWIDGTASGSSAALSSYGWGTVTAGATASEAGFDTTTFRSGSASMKLSQLTTGSTITVSNAKSSVAAGGVMRETFPLAPSTTYTLTGWIKTNNVIANGAWIDLRQYDAASAAITTSSTAKLSGTNGFTQVTVTVTTSSLCRFGVIFLRLNVAGNISDAWFDDVTLTPTNNLRNIGSGRILA